MNLKHIAQHSRVPSIIKPFILASALAFGAVIPLVAQSMPPVETTTASEDKSSLAQAITTLKDFFANGGPVMIPLLACSLIGATIIGQRIIKLKKLSERNEAIFYKKLTKDFNEDEVLLALKRCQQGKSLLSQFTGEAINNYVKGMSADEAIEKATLFYKAFLQPELDKHKAPFEIAFSNLSEIGFIGTLFGVSAVLAAASAILSQSGDKSQLFNGMDVAVNTSILSSISVVGLRIGTIIKGNIKKSITLEIYRAVYHLSNLLPLIDRTKITE